MLAIGQDGSGLSNQLPSWNMWCESELEITVSATSLDETSASVASMDSGGGVGSVASMDMGCDVGSAASVDGGGDIDSVVSLDRGGDIVSAVSLDGGGDIGSAVSLDKGGDTGSTVSLDRGGAVGSTASLDGVAMLVIENAIAAASAFSSFSLSLIFFQHSIHSVNAFFVHLSMTKFAK